MEELLGSFNESAHSVEAVVELSLAENPPLDNGRDNELPNDIEEVPVAELSNENGNTDDVAAVDGMGNDLLDILGVDPSSTLEFGEDIHSKLALRLEYIATAGLTKEARKELNGKYPIPANCLKFGAPSMNLEIKAAVTETVMKRDKGIEARQKQLASAISGLAGLLNKELESKDKDVTRAKQLMDVCRILCDIQHAESITRRNFAIFSIKKELKDHLINTKIDKCLFGENLAETLRSAKAVTKSGSEMKPKLPPRPKPSISSASNLNWKNPVPARKQQSVPRGREAAPPPPVPGPTMRSYHNTTHASSSKTSRYPSKKIRRN